MNTAQNARLAEDALTHENVTPRPLSAAEVALIAGGVSAEDFPVIPR